MKFFISSALAETNTTFQDSPLSLIIMLVIFSLIFYFMVIYPQHKRTKEHKKLINTVNKGDEVLTNGGIVGRITKINNNGYITLALNEANEIIIKRDFITSVLPKGTIKAMNQN